MAIKNSYKFIAIIAITLWVACSATSAWGISPQKNDEVYVTFPIVDGQNNNGFESLDITIISPRQIEVDSAMISPVNLYDSGGVSAKVL